MSTPRPVSGFDLHCHLDLFPDPAALVASCEAAKLVTLGVTTTPRAWAQNRKWTDGSAYVHSAIGLHPELVEKFHAEIDLLEERMPESRFIGEIGLDGTPSHRASWSDQIRVFTRALIAADGLGGRVLSVHSRRAAHDVVRLLREHTTPGRVLPILHWFSDGVATAQEACEAGCYFSINLPMLDTKSGVALIQSLPAERLLTETDAPFTGGRDGASHSTTVTRTVERLADLRGLAEGATLRLLADNATCVFAFAGLSQSFSVGR